MKKQFVHYKRILLHDRFKKRIRCDLHQIPEIGMHEFKTKEYLLNILKKFKCRIFEIGETGLVAFF
ncbi:MAG: hypothetical protein L6U99_11770 [Clostridium sp.]|nr:MAG: hypothetical protein L6U99_11770 [Clostridium sp.]